MKNGDRLRVEDVSVIIVNYNGEKVIAQAVQSVLALRPRPLECIVVDNGSTDQSVNILHRFSDPLLRLVSLTENRGVAGGRNVGVANARGRILAFLDSDGEATASWLVRAVEDLVEQEEAGAIAPLVLMKHGQIINGAGSFLDSSGHGRDRLWGEPLAQHESIVLTWRGQPVDYPMGCGMVIRRQGLEAIWPLDETMPKWHDDTEIGIRIRQLGYHVIFEPLSRVLHHPGHSDPKDNRQRQHMAETARLLLVWKYYPLTRAITVTLHYSFFALTASRYHLSYTKDLWKTWSKLWGERKKIWAIRQRWRNKGNMVGKSFLL
ncbi:glycosyltransferase family 2 protein [Sulfobacillus thermosulfidooxidans]|uniref:glycosyltransferase family 2 protein n=1 Tax=Sulfobacillus thermosulfidooxidans TaxID=28034 RepID=UPI0006B4B2BC|nr:glycosyltransferase [Sulfobacillus thermosulfidooxidans]